MQVRSSRFLSRGAWGLGLRCSWGLRCWRARDLRHWRARWFRCRSGCGFWSRCGWGLGCRSAWRRLNWRRAFGTAREGVRLRCWSFVFVEVLFCGHVGFSFWVGGYGIRVQEYGSSIWRCSFGFAQDRVRRHYESESRHCWFEGRGIPTAGKRRSRDRYRAPSRDRRAVRRLTGRRSVRRGCHTGVCGLQLTGRFRSNQTQT